MGTCNSKALPEAGFQKKSKSQKEKRISKKELLRKVIIFWMSTFVCFFIFILFLCFLLFGFFLSYRHGIWI